jgi:DNA polymerase-3 subunit gamma/tau
MSYLVFARKYRPQRFEDIVAQEHVSRTLQNAVRNSRIGSGYLFCGPRGTGKTTTARVLAKALNCEKGPTAIPCGECSNCREIAGGTSLDVLEIDAASNTGVDDVRALRENVRYLPTSGAKRIYIIDEVHRLSGAAFDALLKTLEEPPEHVVFMMATTEPLKVPETILSRTQRFDLKRVSANELAAHLKKVAEAEGLQIDELALNLLARKADGSVRDALSLLDQIAAFADETISEQLVIEALGLVDRRLLFEFVRAIAESDRKGALDICRRVIEAGTDPADFVEELLEHLRLLMLLAADKDTGHLMEFSPDELTEYQQQAERFSVGDVVRLIKIGGELKRDLGGGLDERLLLEVNALKMAELERTVDLREILAQLQSGKGVASLPSGPGQKKKSELSRPVAGKAPKPAQPARPEPAPAPKSFPKRDVKVEEVHERWPDFLKRVRRQRGMLASQLQMVEVRQVEGNQVSAVFGPNGKVALQVVQKGPNLKLISELLSEHFEADLSIRFELDPRAKGAEAPAGTDRKSFNAAELLEKSPRLKSLVDKVDGEIIGVRKVK